MLFRFFGKASLAAKCLSMSLLLTICTRDRVKKNRISHKLTGEDYSKTQSGTYEINSSTLLGPHSQQLCKS